MSARAVLTPEQRKARRAARARARRAALTPEDKARMAALRQETAKWLP